MPKPDSFVDEYMNKVAKKQIKKEPPKSKVQYRFAYFDREAGVAINVIMPTRGVPEFAVFKRNEGYQLGVTQYKLSDGTLLEVPPYSDPFYNTIYKKIIIPNQIVETEVTRDILDDAITLVLKKWFIQPEEYFVMARNYIKFSWVYERFWRNPYLNIYGDWGTGKSEWGKFIGWFCQYGLVVHGISYSALARMMHMTNCTTVIDEADVLDRTDSEKIQEILRNGYERDGTFIVAETEGKNFMPKSYFIDQPKIIIKRASIKGDALASRSVPFKLTPRDREVPREMRRSDEFDFQTMLKGQIQAITNLLLKWRWDNIFSSEETQIIDDMNIRFTDTISPLLKMANKEDKKVMSDYMKKQERAALSEVSDDFRIQLIRLLVPLFHAKRNLVGRERIFIKDIRESAEKYLTKDMSDADFKRFYNSRIIKRSLNEMGFEIETYGNNPYVRQENLEDVLWRICLKYKIPTNLTSYDEEPVEPKEDTDIKEGEVPF